MKRLVLPILLLLACVIFFGFSLDDLSLIKGDENFYFSSARRMIREGDWITPRYHHHIRFEKPALYYWMVALFFKLFGVSWFSARLTSVLSGSLTVLLVYLMALRLLSKKGALFSPVILATSFLFFWYSRTAVTDITFLFLVTSAFFLFLKGERDGKRAPIVLSAIPLGLSVMAKGPMGVMIFSLSIIFYLISTKKRGVLNGPILILWISLVLLISLPWPLLMYKIHGMEYINHLWKVEAVDKAVGALINPEAGTGSVGALIKYLFYYMPVVLFSFAPWSLFLPLSLKGAGANSREDRLFILSWFWSVFIFFTLASFKHTHYMLLLSPPLAMLIAGFFASAKNDLISRKGPVVIASGSVIVFLLLFWVALPKLDCGTIRSFSLKLAAEIREQDEEIAVVSEGFNIRKIGAYLNNLVADTEPLSGDDLAQYTSVNKQYLTPFLESNRRVYCLVTKKDYLSSVLPESRDKFFILDKSFMWKRFDIKNYLSAIRGRDWDALKEEAYLISNKK
ncbi:MAG: glycosyltransferase family 39 protein [Candidatus Omnitrophota bacterium]